MINSFIGIAASLLLKDNAVVAWVIGGLVISTVLYIERAWLQEHIFRNRRSSALIAYSILTAVFLTGLFMATEPMRKTSAIIESTSTFLNGIKSGDYKDSYARLSHSSQQGYKLADFIEDHSKNQIKIKDFTIDQVTFNKFDSKKALATISSPFTLYGHETLNLELIKETGEWRVVFSRNIVVTGKSSSSGKTNKKGGAITNFLNSLF
jgi:predicted PurR-regulated permease PerM